MDQLKNQVKCAVKELIEKVKYSVIIKISSKRNKNNNWYFLQNCKFSINLPSCMHKFTDSTIKYAKPQTGSFSKISKIFMECHLGSRSFY